MDHWFRRLAAEAAAIALPLEELAAQEVPAEVVAPGVVILVKLPAEEEMAALMAAAEAEQLAPITILHAADKVVMEGNMAAAEAVLVVIMAVPPSAGPEENTAAMERRDIHTMWMIMWLPPKMAHFYKQHCSLFLGKLPQAIRVLEDFH